MPAVISADAGLTEDPAISASLNLTQTPLPIGLSRTNSTRVLPLSVIDVGVRTPYPKSSEAFGEFTLLEELGRGAFARVFLASEHRLADRRVALKITRKANGESRKLARLQHTNIVPIQNAFVEKGWHVVQMPYFGRQTLAHLIDAVRAEKSFPKVDGGVFASTQMKASTSRKPSPSSAALSVATDPPSVKVVVASPEPPEPQPSRELLVGLAYTEAAIWLVARIADGLAHAHSKGILHLDLKPHNVLLSDDGQPMLLDFNLAFDQTTFERDRVGGTWPYMSPEQIREYARRPGDVVDARSDLFALGVIFFELLTLKHPFPATPSTEAGLSMAIAARQTGAPSVRSLNPNVPKSIAAVVEKLLEPSPALRYQSADELRDDLRCHAEHRPLATASDRSLSERATKWHRRNPRMSLLACVATLVIGLVFSAGQMMAWSKDRERVAAAAQAKEFHSDHALLRLNLTLVQDAERRARALEAATVWLTKYQVGAADGWAEAPALRLLPDAERNVLRRALAETVLLAAHAEWLAGRNRPEAEHAASLARGKAANTTAKAAFGDAVPAALLAQAAELDGQPVTISTELSDDPVDLYARAARLLADGRCREAAGLLLKLTQVSPDHFAGQFALGYCYDMLGQVDRAAERFQVAKPLRTDDARPAFHRGILMRNVHRLEEAEADFTEALNRDTRYPGVRVHRAVLRQSRNDAAGALQDLSSELELEQGQSFIALAVRSQIYATLGRTAEADRDAVALASLQPLTDLDFVARGSQWLKTDPLKALEDYHRALKLNPACCAALQNSAHVYCERLHEPDLALGAISKAAAVHPGFNQVRASHAVLLARTGRRTQAHAEAEAALLLGHNPLVTYQACCAFALTAQTVAADADRAIALFRQCLREGYRDFARIQHDPDVEAIRSLPEFQSMLHAAMEMAK